MIANSYSQPHDAERLNRDARKAMHRADVAAALAAVPGGWQTDILFDLLRPRLDALHSELMADLQGLINSEWRDAPNAADELLDTAHRIYAEVAE